MIRPFGRRRRRAAAQRALDRMHPEVRTALEKMDAGVPQSGSDGSAHELRADTRISRNKGAFLFELHERLRPKLSVEVGFAYGYSTLYILAAMKSGGYGHHMAIDPYQSQLWHGIGLRQVTRIGMEERFTFVDDFSVSALSKMTAAGEKAELIFVEGDHKFDSVLGDFTCAARICPVDGFIVFDDLWMPAIKRVIAFVRKNRPDFVEEPTTSRGLAAFRRVGGDERGWDHFVSF